VLSSEVQIKMMLKLFVVGAAIFSLTTAAPSALTKRKADLETIAEFNDLPSTIGITLTPVDEYQGIFWKGMALIGVIPNPPLTGVTTQPYGNYIGFTALSLLTIGKGQPSMTVNYEGSKVNHFDLKEFYYRCELALKQTILAPATGCSMTVKGFESESATEPKVMQKFKFEAKLVELEAVKMQKAVLEPSFRGLKKVEFYVTNDEEILNPITAGVIDSVTYVLHQD
jgi:hypothetical protein